MLKAFEAAASPSYRAPTVTKAFRKDKVDPEERAEVWSHDIVQCNSCFIIRSDRTTRVMPLSPVSPSTLAACITCAVLGVNCLLAVSIHA